MNVFDAKFCKEYELQSKNKIVFCFVNTVFPFILNNDPN